MSIDLARKSRHLSALSHSCNSVGRPPRELPCGRPCSIVSRIDRPVLCRLSPEARSAVSQTYSGFLGSSSVTWHSPASTTATGGASSLRYLRSPKLTLTSSPLSPAHGRKLPLLCIFHFLHVPPSSLRRRNYELHFSLASPPILVFPKFQLVDLQTGCFEAYSTFTHAAADINIPKKASFSKFFRSFVAS